MQGAATLFKVLGDAARLRLMRVLARGRFNVTELTGILGLAQSGVSRHLGLLKEAGLVAEEREGAFTFYRVAAAADGARGPLWQLLEGQFAAEHESPEARADDARLQEVLRLRRENFDRHSGADTRDRRQLVPGRSWAAWARALGMLLPPLDVVDVGCGEGYLTIEIARWASRVIAVDRSPVVLARGRELAARRRVTNIVWKKGDLERLPLERATMDLALFSQALHHAAHPERALAEAARVLRPGGRVLILDLRPHGEAWVHEKLGDTWLGFSNEELEALLSGAGFESLQLRTGARRSGDPFSVVIASGRQRPQGRGKN